MNQKLTEADAGCWIDGHWGQFGSSRAVQIAHEFGWEKYPVVHPDEEFIHEIADEAIDWLNDTVAPKGYAFGWWEGELFLQSYADWEDGWGLD